MWPCPKCGRHGEINLDGPYYRAGGRGIFCDGCRTHYNYGVTPPTTAKPQPQNVRQATPAVQQIDPRALVIQLIDGVIEQRITESYEAAAELMLSGATRLDLHRRLAIRGLGFAQAARIVADLEGYFSGTFTPPAIPAVPAAAVAAAAVPSGDGVWGEVLTEFVFGFIQGVVEG
jgi:hypothetical protein